MKRLMKRFSMCILALLALAACFAPGAAAAITYSVDNTNGTCVGSKVIHASDSGMTSAHYAVTVYDATTRIPVSHYTASINTSNYDLTLTFGSTYFPNGYCGLIKLRGMFGASDTSNANDFVVGIDGGRITVSVQGSYSQRTTGGVTYASDLSSFAGVTFSDYCVSENYVYFAPGNWQLTVANSVDVSCVSADSHLAVAYGTGFPSGSVPLGRIANNGSQLLADGDFRPW